MSENLETVERHEARLDLAEAFRGPGCNPAGGIQPPRRIAERNVPQKLVPQQKVPQKLNA